MMGLVLRRRWPVALVGLSWLGTLAVFGLLISSPSPSLPPGLYIRAWPFQALRVGDLVLFAPPAAFRQTLLAPQAGLTLLKEVAGLAGTYVCWEQTRMVVHTVGEERHYLYAPDAPLPPQMEGCQVLRTDDMLVVGHHARSVDSRYLGPVPRQHVRGRVWPLWTKETG